MCMKMIQGTQLILLNILLELSVLLDNHAFSVVFHFIFCEIMKLIGYLLLFQSSLY